MQLDMKIRISIILRGRNKITICRKYDYYLENSIHSISVKVLISNEKVWMKVIKIIIQESTTFLHSNNKENKYYLNKKRLQPLRLQ